jgi:hypothetical protein
MAMKWAASATSHSSRPGRAEHVPPTLCAALALALSACRGEFDFPQRVEAAPVVVDEPKCFVRARFFHGLVQAPCADIVREVRP